MSTPPNERTQVYEETVKKTLFYSLLEGIPTQKIPLKMETMHLTILELNQYCSINSDEPQDEKNYEDKKYIIGCVNTAFRLLFKEGVWKPEYGTNFFRKLHHLNTLSAAKKNMASPLFGRIEEMEDTAFVQEVVEEGLAARYLSKKTKKVMDKHTKDLFEPFRDILLAEGGDDSKATTQSAMVKVSNTYFTDAVQDSAKSTNALSSTVVGPIFNWIPTIGATGELIEATDAFKETTCATKNFYMDNLRKFLLEQTKQNTAAMQVTHFATDISEKRCTISFGWVAVGEKRIIKAITVSWAHPQKISQDSSNDDYDSELDFQDPCFFIQPVNVPEQLPDPRVSNHLRPLYTINGGRLEKMSPETREEVIRLIPQLLKPQDKCAIECEIHTGIWYEREFMHVYIMTLIGIMLNSHVLYGAIRTFENQSEGNEGFKITLRNDLEAALVLVAKEYLSGWYQPDLLKPLIAAAFPQIKELYSMKNIKERGLAELYDVERPGFGFLSSIQAFSYQNPDELVPLNAAKAQKTSKHMQFEECKTLLNAALKAKKPAVYLTLVKEMVSGMHDIMKIRIKKEKNETGFIEAIKNQLPKEKITEIMSTSEPLDQKAALLIFALLTEKSLGIESSPEQKKEIKKSLNLKG